MNQGKKGQRKSIGIIILIVFMILATLTSTIGFIIDYKWFSEVGYTQVFLKEILTKSKIGIPAFFIISLLLYFYFRTLKKLYNKNMMIFQSKEQNKKENRWLLIASALLSIIISSLITSNLWYKILEFFQSSDFHVTDPVFKKDMSFYVFKLPLLEQIYSTGLVILLLLAIVTLAYFFIMLIVKGKQKIFRPEEENKINFKETYHQFISLASRQLGVVLGVFFLFLAFGYVLRSYTLLYSSRGIVFGASYIDLKVILWLYRISAIIALISAVLLVIAGYRKKIKLALVGPVLMIAITILGNIVAMGMENFIVSPNELAKEKPYIINHIEYTQKAYGLDQIEEKEFSVQQNITPESLEENSITINNIPINDYRPTLSMYNSLQGFRRYYEFHDVDIDRYNIDGEYTQVFLSARELNQNKIDESSRTWINKYLKYTHGFGAAVSPVNEVNEVGQPELLVKDIPPQTQTELEITEPRIYFGELTNDYAITNTKAKEFDYPEGDDNKENVYDGNAGIPLNFINRTLFAINKGSLRIMLSNDITSDSKILINRNIVDRVQKIAPFFSYDEDPYLVIEDGKLYWIMDGFTTSNRYAYSQPMGKGNSYNYIRNSVKVVVDAYNGDTTFYQVNKDDPIASTYGKIYPGLLKDIEEMPEGIRKHIRYSQALFDVQSEIYRTYHMENPNVFYNREDVWEIANQKYGKEQEEIVESAYIVMKLPDREEEEFVLMVPYTPREKDNMISWMAGLNDGEDYGKLVIYKFPKQKLVYGPMQIEKRIDQDPNISKELTLLDQQGSNVLRGNLLTIPVDDSLIFVEPIYIESTGSERNLPEVKRVIVSYENKIVMAETLQGALDQIFGLSEDQDQDQEQENITDETPIGQGQASDLVKRANNLFEQAENAQRQGNWAEYGELIQKLQDTLKQLEKSIGENTEGDSNL
ncbi:UPF0182 family protein [Irregularibacter muris]|uniref:UPF0182 protein NSA47_13265 n=1 Tax=Irregularibacter muris TaxID=1796619 RepID=A0AAE3KZY5_9FIRM|nr:UPF0182 family protein [Irregularibacter muris]MCR1899940.1 UPF0182 family protein [Irregularibacter muris]